MFEQRIAQWKKMTEEDPSNAMGWFSLGGAYKEADDLEQAAASLRKAIELDTTFSRAYQLLGQVLIAAGATDPAAEVLTTGYTVAAEHGDVMPQRAMGALLEKLDKPVPQVEGAQTGASVEVGEGQVLDRRTGEPGSRMKDPPFHTPAGRVIQDHYSAETWGQWIAMGTKVINELRLDFSQPHAAEAYDNYMMEWLGFTKEEVEQYEKEN